MCLYDTFLVYLHHNSPSKSDDMKIVIVICLLAIVLAVVFLLIERLLCGKHIDAMFPCKPIQCGNHVHIYMDGKYNRTARISSVQSDKFMIYGTIPMDIAYRGRFYAIGNTSDGHRLLYLPNRNYVYLVKLASIARRIFDIPDFGYTLEPSDAVQESENAAESLSSCDDEEERFEPLNNSEL